MLTLDNETILIEDDILSHMSNYNGGVCNVTAAVLNNVVTFIKFNKVQINKEFNQTYLNNMSLDQLVDLILAAETLGVISLLETCKAFVKNMLASISDKK